MNAPQSAPARKGMIVLHERIFDTKRSCSVLVVAFKEESPLVDKDTGFQDNYSLDMRMRCLHFFLSRKRSSQMVPLLSLSPPKYNLGKLL